MSFEIRAFCQGRSSHPHERTRMEEDLARHVARCPVEGCGETLTKEVIRHTIPARYRYLLTWEFLDIGAIDVIRVGPELRVEYPRANQVED